MFFRKSTVRLWPFSNARTSSPTSASGSVLPSRWTNKSENFRPNTSSIISCDSWSLISRFLLFFWLDLLRFKCNRRAVSNVRKMLLQSQDWSEASKTQELISKNALYIIFGRFWTKNVIVIMYNENVSRKLNKSFRYFEKIKNRRSTLYLNWNFFRRRGFKNS